MLQLEKKEMNKKDYFLKNSSGETSKITLFIGLSANAPTPNANAKKNNTLPNY